jgi:tRNA (cmo5U34)-methyltransferase
VAREAVKSVGDGIEARNAGWSFGGDTPKVFDEHVRKSVPLYREGHDLILRMSDFFVRDGGSCYDIGCSTGALLLELADRHSGRSVRWVGVEVEEAMVESARGNVQASGLDVEIVHQDVAAVDFEPADLIVAYYTVQFVHPAQRQALLDRLYASLNWGGALLMFEKVRGADARFQDIASGIYTDFKLEQGFSEAEIIGKTRSLRGVMEPFSEQGNLDLLTRAGFVDVMTVMKWVCFQGFLAIK